MLYVRRKTQKPKKQQNCISLNIYTPPKQTVTMKEEVQCASEFFSRMLLKRNLPAQFVKPFKKRLEELLVERFKNHWDPSNPNKGSAYRCIRINGKLDPVVREAAKVTGLSNISAYLPTEFTMWVDPRDVSYRFGEDGSICSCPLDFMHTKSEWASTASCTSSSTTVSTVNSNSSSVRRPRVSQKSPTPDVSSSYYVNTVYHRLTPHRLDYAIPVQV